MKTFLFFLLFITTFCQAKPPTLTPHDTKVKIQEILKSHISYRELNEEIIQRAFSNYLEELDPLKTYFIESEVLEWTNPTDDVLKTTLKNIQNEDFSIFSSFHNIFLELLARRASFEAEILNSELPL
ncbi:MAG: carboxy terminal-processing peptidase, partial [Verrucomicrobia bacterium]|nr:carboxy terminal-processing peptidase [Verrucomicrobiota bacterium]